MESKSFPSNFDIARRYAKHRKQHYLRYGEQRLPNTKTGMLGSDEKIIPEFYLGNRENLPKNAKLKIYDKDGKVLKEYNLNDDMIWK